MNKERRKKIEGIFEKLEAIYTELEELETEEQEAFDNLPESIQGGEKGVNMENIIDCISNATQSIGESKDFLEEIINL